VATQELGNLVSIKAWVVAFIFCSGLSSVTGAEDERKRPVDGIMDNSFLVEEAYNQEPGVVQHIFNAIYGFEKFSGAGPRRLDLSFTQEWPAWGQAHQFSYSIPYSFSFADHQQAFFDERTLTAFAPRLSLIVPTGDAAKGFGADTVGFQGNLPFSTTLNDWWFVHANAGLTFLPHAGPQPRNDLLNFNLGASAIFCPTERLNLMLEWVGAWNETSFLTGTHREFSSVISPGLRFAFNFPGEAQLVFGVAAPIGLTRNTPDIGLLFYLSFEHRVWGKPAP
jgi:hypothetical protein